jgi:hypothetical protein
MTSTLPSGGGTPEGAEPDGALDPDSAPATGLDPDTAPDAAGERDTSTSNNPSGTTDAAVERSAAPADESGQPLIGDPALDNEDEMRQAGADLQSSREKAATARDISDRLTAATRPEAADGERT